MYFRFCPQLRNIVNVYVYYNLYVAAEERLEKKERDIEESGDTQDDESEKELHQLREAKKHAALMLKLASDRAKGEGDFADGAPNVTSVQEASSRGTPAVNNPSRATAASVGIALDDHGHDVFHPLVAEVTVLGHTAPKSSLTTGQKIGQLFARVAFFIYMKTLGWLLTPDVSLKSSEDASLAVLMAALVKARGQRRMLAAKIAQARGTGFGSWIGFTPFGEVRGEP